MKMKAGRIGTYYQMTREDKVKEFREAAGKREFAYYEPKDDSIIPCIQEEFMEFCEALDLYENSFKHGHGIEEARQQLCKEWADLQYVVSQAAVYYKIPADEAFDRVHNSNMSKVVDGKVIFRDDGKILKPDTYQKPDMKGL